MIKKLLPWLFLSPLYLLLAIFIYWGFLSTQPTSIFKLISYSPTTLSVDDNLILDYNVVVLRPCVYQLERSLYNPTTKETFALGTEIVRYDESIIDFKRIVQIPKTIPDGRYQYIIRGTGICNPFNYLFPKTITNIDLKIFITIDNSPGNVVSINIENPVLKDTDSLILRSFYDRRRVCQLTVGLVIYDEKGIIVRPVSRAGIFLKVGKANISENIDVAGLSPGKYYITKSLTSQCTDKTYFQEYPSQNFEIVE